MRGWGGEFMRKGERMEMERYYLARSTAEINLSWWRVHFGFLRCEEGKARVEVDDGIDPKGIGSLAILCSYKNIIKELCFWKSERQDRELKYISNMHRTDKSAPGHATAGLGSSAAKLIDVICAKWGWCLCRKPLAEQKCSSCLFLDYDCKCSLHICRPHARDSSIP